MGQLHESCDRQRSSSSGARLDARTRSWRTCVDPQAKDGLILPELSKGQYNSTVAASYEEVVTAELALLLRVAKRLCGDLDDAEDLVGVALLNAAKAWYQFDGTHPRSWLIRILKNEYQNVTRKRIRRGDTLSLTDLDVPETKTAKRLTGSLLNSALSQALDALPEDFRMAVVLCDIEEMSYEDAANSLGVGVGTLRTRLHRGRRSMRQILTDRLGEDLHAIASPF